MTFIGKLWTASIAYVALAVGAGLSIMYNVVDTMAVRGAALDVYDITTAVAAPAIVVLMVELFVSNWWVDTRWPMQALRWLGCLVIGGVAMRASWTHGHDFMARRGQAADVAITWPLAIDLLAVMATALILAGRRARMSAVTTDTVTSVDLSGMVKSVSFGQTVTDEMSAKLAGLADGTMSVSGTFDDGRDRWADLTVMDMSEDGQDYTVTRTPPVADTANLNGMATWAEWTPKDDAEVAALALAVDMATPLPHRTRTPAGRSYPQEFADMFVNWEPEVLPRADMVKLSAAWFGVSERTVRRWLAAIYGAPISGAE